MHVVIFEGNHWTTFAPLALSRPVFCLLCGTSTLVEKAVKHTQATRVTLWVRPAFEAYCRAVVAPLLGVPVSINTPLDDEPALLLSGRAMHMARYEFPPAPAVVVDEEDVIRSAFVRAAGLGPADVMQRSSRWTDLLALPRCMQQTRLPRHIWDLIGWNEEAIVTDSIHLTGYVHPSSDGPYHLIDPSNIWISNDVKFAPGCVLDASRGPIVLGAGASIGANSVLIGPCSIGAYSTILPLAFIRSGTSIGPVCRIGGEIGNSLVLGYANKQHDGYVGDSYIGEWVNLGAGTTTSNLKNTYGEIAIPMGGTETPTGRRLLGSILGDHTRTGIGTRLNTGTYAGYCTMIAASAIAPRYVPSFSWLTDDGLKPYRPEKAAEVMRLALARRNRDWSDAEQNILDYAHVTAPTIEKPGHAQR